MLVCSPPKKNQDGEDGGERKGEKDKGRSPGGRPGPRQGGGGEEEGDELHNYSAQYGESEATPGAGSCGHTAHTVRPPGTCANHRYGNGGPSPSHSPPHPQPTSQPPQQSFHGADDDSLPPDQVSCCCCCTGFPQVLESWKSPGALCMNRDN